MIYQAYISHIKKTNMERLKEVRKEVEPEEREGKSLYSASFRRCLRVMERMIIQNENQDKFFDYKYLFSGAEVPKSGRPETNPCPLWRFAHAGAKKASVTTVRWNPKYADLFAVGYGSYEFGKRGGQHAVCLFSIKNSTYPDTIIPTEDAVLCLEFSPFSPAILACGLANGNVVVFDVRSRSRTPVYASGGGGGRRHSDAVWGLRW